MNRKLVKVLSIIFIIIQIVLIANMVFAEEPPAKSGYDLAKSFDGQPSGVDTSSGETIIKKSIGPFLQVVRIVATGIAIIMITYLGIQYMSAAPQEKADIKNKLITFVVGVIVVVATTKLLSTIKTFAESATNIP